MKVRVDKPMHLRTIFLTVLAAVGALAIVACLYLQIAPTTWVEANGVHIARSMTLLPPGQWSFRRVSTCGPQFTFTRQGYGIIAVSEESSSKTQGTAH